MVKPAHDCSALDASISRPSGLGLTSRLARTAHVRVQTDLAEALEGVLERLHEHNRVGEAVWEDDMPIKVGHGDVNALGDICTYRYGQVCWDQTRFRLVEGGSPDKKELKLTSRCQMSLSMCSSW